MAEYKKIGYEIVTTDNTIQIQMQDIHESEISKSYFGRQPSIIFSLAEKPNIESVNNKIDMDIEDRKTKFVYYVNGVQSLTFGQKTQNLPKKCSCSMNDLMKNGCKCGGI